ncbi:MAG: methionine--tRNA ligase, partial [Oscillospiraceae bacterium]|nr:methionine--tRNA ligase [Oscillospiraceae bacterium]
YIRKASKYMAKAKAEADKADDNELRRKWLINVFHMIKTAAVLLHPIAPVGTEMVRDYLNIGEEMWNWDYIFDGLADNILKGETEHEIKFLEPRVDFFKRHESQFNKAEP